MEQTACYITNCQYKKKRQPIFNTQPMRSHIARFVFSLLAYLLQMLLGSKINSQAPIFLSNFYEDHHDGRWIIKRALQIPVQILAGKFQMEFLPTISLTKAFPVAQIRPI